VYGLKCPYNRRSIKYVKKTTNDLCSEETGILKSYVEIYNEEYELMECLKDDCGTYRNGRCCYYVPIGGDC
jgi:hypothetical protein